METWSLSVSEVGGPRVNKVADYSSVLLQQTEVALITRAGHRQGCTQRGHALRASSSFGVICGSKFSETPGRSIGLEHPGGRHSRRLCVLF